MIYVDAIIQWGVAGKSAQVQRTFKGGSCHLVTDGDLEELHAFAARIGMKREWFQGPGKASHPHYDLTPARRARAVALGAQEVDRRRFVEIMREWRAKNRPSRGVEGELQPLQVKR